MVASRVEESEGATPGTRVPERSCALTRRTDAPDRLIRFVADPDGRVVPDLAHKLPGRGVWLTPTRETVLQAVRQKVFTRSLKRETQADETLADLVGDLLLARVIQKLAMANKAGLVVSGAAKVERAIERGRAFAVLHACDAAKDGMRKIDQKLAHFLADTGVAESERAGRVVGFLTSAELSLAIGRPNVVHAALSSGGASRSFLAEAERLLGYRLGVTANTKARGQTAGTERA